MRRFVEVVGRKVLSWVSQRIVRNVVVPGIVTAVVTAVFSGSVLRPEHSATEAPARSDNTEWSRVSFDPTLVPAGAFRTKHAARKTPTKLQRTPLKLPQARTEVGRTETGRSVKVRSVSMPQSYFAASQLADMSFEVAKPERPARDEPAATRFRAAQSASLDESVGLPHALRAPDMLPSGAMAPRDFGGSPLPRGIGAGFGGAGLGGMGFGGMGRALR